MDQSKALHIYVYGEIPLVEISGALSYRGNSAEIPLRGRIYFIVYKWDLELIELSAYGGSGVPGSPCQSPSGLGA